jgi:outer membrane protein OmpA-like peptidoglycan-associated protein
MKLPSMALAAAAMLAAGPARLRADGWLVAEAPAAVAISEPQSGLFRTGVMPALGAYTDNGIVALGLRMRAGVLRNGPAPAGQLGDPGMGGLGTVGVALRLALHGPWNGPWIEGVAGGGITGRDVVPAIEAGVGWDFAAGPVDVGPSARYVRVVSRAPDASLGSANLLLVGIDVRFGKARPALPHGMAMAAATPRVAPPPRPEVDRDRDRVVEHEAGCDRDPDGCELAPQIVMHDDRIVLEERVLFDTDRARIRSQGREVIGELVRIWNEHPEWLRMTIEGHADVRGTDDYNLELSQRRAEHVRDELVRSGADPARISTVGYGRSRPVDPATSDEAHQHNRRVEFVIDRKVAIIAGGQP